MPVLAGQVAPGRPRLTWEAPAAWGAEALCEAGFAGVAVEPLLDYWWAPAVLVTGSSCAALPGKKVEDTSDALGWCP